MKEVLHTYYKTKQLTKCNAQTYGYRVSYVTVAMLQYVHLVALCAGRGLVVQTTHAAQLCILTDRLQPHIYVCNLQLVTSVCMLPT